MFHIHRQGKTDLVCKYYDAGYSIEKLAPELIQQWTDIEPHADLHLPKVNEFIPDSLDVVVPKVEKDVKDVPTMVKDNELIRVWYKQDDTFFLPKSCIKVAVSRYENKGLILYFIVGNITSF